MATVAKSEKSQVFCYKLLSKDRGNRFVISVKIAIAKWKGRTDFMSNRLSSDAKPRSHAFRVVLLLLVISFCCAVLAACDTSSSNAQTGPTEGEKLSSFHYDQPAFTVYVGSYGWVTDCLLYTSRCV